MKRTFVTVFACSAIFFVLVALPAFALYISIADLGTLSADASEASGINDAGQVIGTLYFQSGSNSHALFWEAGAMTDIGTLGGSSSHPSSRRSINGIGQTVGSSDTSGGQEHAFMWRKGAGMTDLGTLGGNISSANAINDAGQVVRLPGKS